MLKRVLGFVLASALFTGSTAASTVSPRLQVPTANFEHPDRVSFDPKAQGGGYSQVQLAEAPESLRAILAPQSTNPLAPQSTNPFHGGTSISIGEGQVGVGAGISGGFSSNLGGSRFGVGGSLSGGVNVCVPGLSAPRLPRAQIPGMPGLSFDYSIDIDFPSFTKPEFYWEVVTDFNALIDQWINQITDQTRQELCYMAQTVREIGDRYYDGFASGVRQTMPQYETSDGYVHYLPRERGIERGARRLTPERHEDRIRERHVARTTMALHNEIIHTINDVLMLPANVALAPSDAATNRLRVQFYNQVESRFCDPYGNHPDYGPPLRGDQFYERPIDRRFEFGIEINIADISAILSDLKDRIKDRVYAEMQAVFSNIISASQSVPRYPPVCIYTPVACFCIDMGVTDHLDEALEDAFNDLNQIFMEHDGENAKERMPGSVMNRHRQFSLIREDQSNYRSSRRSFALDHSSGYFTQEPPANEWVANEQFHARQTLKEAQSDLEEAGLTPYTQSNQAYRYAQRKIPGFDDPQRMPFLPDRAILERERSTTIVLKFQQTRRTMKDYLAAQAIQSLAQEQAWMEQAQLTFEEVMAEVEHLVRAGQVRQLLLVESILLEMEAKILESNLRQEALYSLLIIMERASL